MKLLRIVAMVGLIFMCSCASLKPVIVNQHSQLDGYKYVYITPTSSLTSSSGSVSNGNGSTISRSVNPSDTISGYLIKNGYVITPQIEPELASKTLIINYGQSGRRNICGGWFGYTTEITLQFLSADTYEVVCTSTAEGQGTTEADDIRIAIIRALDEVLSPK